MLEYQEIPSKFPSASSSENRNSANSLDAEADGGDEGFYEEIEAPKFVDFTVPDHYKPDDRYWFCLRVGCDQKHEEEMDSEEIYKNFVLRVMAARSPNVKLRRVLDRNASRTPIKCPLSAPPKSSKPRLSRMAIISSFSKKMTDEKKKVVMKPIVKSGSTPVTKTKPVAAKYLTTPRNKRSISNQNSFRSVRNPKPVNVEGGKGRVVAKALVFHSPKKAVKVKTSVELHTPISKLCEGMSKLEIASQKKRALGCSNKSSKNLGNGLSRRQLSSCKVQRKFEEPQTRNNKEAKSGKSVKTKVKGQLLKQQASKKLLQSDETDSSMNNESRDTKQDSTKNVTEDIGLEESGREEECGSSTVPLPTCDFDINLECSGGSADQLNANNSSEGERDGDEYIYSDDKENASASDGNRIINNLKENERRIFGLHEKCGQVKKKVTEANYKKLKERSSGQTMKLNKPKATNPKPFRLRTDERGILKEASLERRTEPLAPQRESGNSSTLCGKLQRKQGTDIQQKRSTMTIGVKTQKGQERSKASAAAISATPLRSNAMQRLEKFRKITSPLPKHSVKPQGVVSTKEEMISYLIPGQKLEVIHEASPEVASERTREEKAAGKCPIMVAMKPNFHSTHVPRSCSKKLK